MNVDKLTFEARRAALSHTILQNGILLRLATPPDLWGDRRLSEEERLEALSSGWVCLRDKPDSIKKAAKVWGGDNYAVMPVPALVRELYASAFTGIHFRPRATFPNSDTLDGWLNGMDRVIHRLNAPAAEVAHLPIADVGEFWVCAIQLMAFLSRIQIGGNEFWEYFEKIPG